MRVVKASLCGASAYVVIAIRLNVAEAVSSVMQVGQCAGNRVGYVSRDLESCETVAGDGEGTDPEAAKAAIRRAENCILFLAMKE